MGKFTTVALFCVAFAGCAKGPDSDTQGLQHRVVTGSITAEIQKIQASENLESCDRDPHLRSMQLELARALDERTAAIEQVSRGLPPSPVWRRVALGPILVRERGSEPVPTPSPGWHSYDYNWSELFDFYLQIKDTATDANWVELNLEVRGILPDDEDRLEGVNYYNDKDSAPSVLGAIAVVSACLSDASCTSPDFAPRTVPYFMESNGIYAGYLARLAAAQGSAAKRDVLQHLSKRLANDYKRYEFKSNPLVQRTSAKELRLPLEAGPFAGVTSQLQNYIESAWTSSALSLKIDWVTSSSVDLFHFVVEPGEGGRSFVSWSEKKIHLYSDVRAPSIAHEVGHVLGFRDHYYTVWHPERCSYTAQVLPVDLMADSGAGAVTSDEWTELDSRYPRR